MKSHDVEPLADELRSLLSAERERPGMPADARARLAAALGVGPEGGGGASGEAPAARRHPPTATSPRWFARPRFVGPVTFALGLAGGAVIHDRLDRLDRNLASEGFAAPVRAPIEEVAEPVAVPPALVAPSPVAPPPVVVEASPDPSIAAAPIAVAPRHHAAHADPRSDDGQAAPSGRDADLAAERALLEIARTALGRGRNEQAIASLSQHARRFAAGQLAEERDSLWVQALVQAGRDHEARERGERFRREHPESFLRRAVDDALQSIP